MTPTPQFPALLLIDFQKGFDDVDYWGGQRRNNPDAEKNASALLNRWRAEHLPIFHVKHNSLTLISPLHPDNPGNEFKPGLNPKPGEPIIEKNVNSAFIGTDLKAQLDAKHITQLVIVGLTTDHCVSTTTRMAANLGYDTYVVSDASATFNRKSADGEDFLPELIHNTALASLNGEFATILSTQQALDRFLSGPARSGL